MKAVAGGLRAVYRTLELPGKNPLKEAHAALDRAVLDAYGFDPKGDLLAQLLALNLEVAARESAARRSPPPASRPPTATPPPSSPTIASAPCDGALRWVALRWPTRHN